MISWAWVRDRSNLICAKLEIVSWGSDPNFVKFLVSHFSRILVFVSAQLEFVAPGVPMMQNDTAAKAPAQCSPWAIFFLFLAQISNIFQVWPALENIFKTRPFGPATMHGGANTQNPAMHGGGVLLLTWHGSGGHLLTWLTRGGYVAKSTPPPIMAGCNPTAHHGWVLPVWQNEPHSIFSLFPGGTFVYLW